MRQADTDVRHQHSEPRDDTTASPGREPSTAPWAAGTSERVGELLGEWQRTELRIARSFAECRGLGTEQLEDLYQETALALLTRPYGSEEHLRNALRHGIKQRALNVHRNHRRRTQILAHSAPSMQRIAEAGQSETGPMQAALSEQDRLIVKEFLTELDELEQQVFWLTAEGMRYRAIAPILGIPVNEARKASRSCEQKRERFQLLYDTGRLCGYRSASIQALQRGELTSAELAARAFAHLDACAQCRAEHKTNSRRLGRTFQDQLAAVLPLPTLVGGLSWLRRPWLRVVTHLGGGLWERTAALIGAGGAGAKLTAGLATVAVVAGGAIGATRATEHRATPARPHTAVQAARATTTGWVPSATTPHHDLGIKRAGRDTRAARPRTQAHAARLPAPSPTLTASGGQDDAQREFGPETAAANGGASPEPTGQARPPAEETAGREFGI